MSYVQNDFNFPGQTGFFQRKKSGELVGKSCYVPANSQTMSLNPLLTDANNC